MAKISPRKSAKNPKEIRVLGIETSCDETSVALLQFTINNEQLTIKKHLIATQIPIHARYGGVVPEIAARTHVAEVVSLLEKTLNLSSHVARPNRPNRLEPDVGRRTWDAGRFDAIAVTQGPGLATALRVGFEAGKTLAWAYDKPLVPVNHLEGHMASAWLVPANRKNWKFPILFLLVSGGHTELVLMKDFGDYKVLGRTRDDAAGECFDKTAKLLGVPYPGGPHLSKLAVNGNPKAFDLPRPMINDPSFDFSFSGLKTAVRTALTPVKGRGPYGALRPAPLLHRYALTPAPLPQKQERGSDSPLSPASVGERGWGIEGGSLADFCASIQAAIVDVLVSKTIKAALKVNPTAVAVVGGVSANSMLKSELKKALRKACPKVKFLAPAKGLYTDNGAMIAAAGLWSLMKNKKLPAWRNLDAEPDLDL